MTRRRGELIALALLTAAFLLMGAALAAGTPTLQNPDEPSHTDMVWHYAYHPTRMAGPSLRQTTGVREALAATGMTDHAGDREVSRIPAERPPYRSFSGNGGATEPTGCPVTCQSYQFIHPPGWYLAAAPVVRVLSGASVPTVVLGIRLLNVLLAAVAVPATWFVARQVRPGRPWFAVAAAGVTASFAPFVATAAAVNNDGGVIAVMAILGALCARSLRTGVDVRLASAIGGVVSLGLLVKGEFLVAGVVAFGVVIASQAIGRRRDALIRFLAFAAPGGLWWARVLLDTKGKVTPRGLELVRDMEPGTWHRSTILEVLGDRWPGFVDQFFGRYGWKLITPTGWITTATQLVILAVGAGWLFTCLTRDERPRVDDRRVALGLTALPALLFVGALVAAYQSYRSHGQVSGFSPRYVYGAMPVLAVGLMAGITSIAERFARHLVTGVQLAAIAGVAVWGAAAVVIDLRGQYQTADWGLLFQRAGVVAPVAHPKALLLLIAVGWGAAIVGAIGVVARSDRTAG